MSKQNLISFLQSTVNDEQLSARLKHEINYEDFRAIANDRGYDFGDLSPAQAKRTIQIVTGRIKEELTNEELELVASRTRTTESVHIPSALTGRVLEDYDTVTQYAFYERWSDKLI